MLKEVAAALGVHREKLDVVPMSILGLVTELITRNDPEWQLPGAKAALKSEVHKLLREGVWDETCMSKKV